MKKTIFLTAAVLFAVLLFSTDINAQTIKGGQGKGIKTNWVDANGDGICDNVGTAKQGMGKGYGKKDGTGNPMRPQDGTGYGKKNGAGNGTGNGTGTGICDGTGSKGKMMRGGRK